MEGTALEVEVGWGDGEIPVRVLALPEITIITNIISIIYDFLSTCYRRTVLGSFPMLSP